MSDVKSYVAFKRKALEAMQGLDGGTVDIGRSGSWWSLGIRGEWASVWGHYFIGHDQSVEEFCASLVADWEAESWNNAHC